MACAQSASRVRSSCLASRSPHRRGRPARTPVRALQFDCDTNGLLRVSPVRCVCLAVLCWLSAAAATPCAASSRQKPQRTKERTEQKTPAEARNDSTATGTERTAGSSKQAEEHAHAAGACTQQDEGCGQRCASALHTLSPSTGWATVPDTLACIVHAWPPRGLGAFPLRGSPPVVRLAAELACAQAHLVSVTPCVSARRS
jgi:hypothetical protein